MSSTAPLAPAPGWYTQPEGSERFWNGEQWTEHFRAAGSQAPITAVADTKERSGLAITSLCLGIGAIVTGAGMNVLFWAAWALGGAAVVTGAIGRNGPKRKMALWGLVLGLAGIAFGVYGFVEVQKAVNDLQQVSNSYGY
jgi:hypothetical protein